MRKYADVQMGRYADFKNVSKPFYTAEHTDFKDRILRMGHFNYLSCFTKCKMFQNPFDVNGQW
jgi:hypothetical protein